MQTQITAKQGKMAHYKFENCFIIMVIHVVPTIHSSSTVFNEIGYHYGKSVTVMCYSEGMLNSKTCLVSFVPLDSEL